MKPFRLGSLVVAVLLLFSTLARAQGSIAGVVKDSSGALLPGVTVEASSPALIEKTRTVVTDGTGQYKIIDLRPGTYTVSFTLTGFSTVKREGIEIAGSFAANVNADLAVGSLAETVTVSGESPIVDVQNTKRSNVISSTVVDALPTSRSQYTLAVLVPGATRTGGLQDVGGTRTMQITTFSIHGSRPFDQRLMINGITSRNFLSSAWASNFVPDMGTAQETVVDYSSGTADSVGGGMGINVIPKEGGNRFVGSFFITGASGSFQGNNYTDELKAQGLSSPNELKRVYDINPNGGGPIIRDKLWFYGSLRFQESSYYPAGGFANLNGGDLTKWTYVPDPSTPGLSRLTVNPSGSVRLTYQATPRNKIAFSAEPQNRHWINGLSASFSPEIYPDWQFNHESLTTVTWQSPVTSRLLLEARFADHAEGFVDKYPEVGDPYRKAIPVRDLNTNFLYRGKGYCCLPVFFGTQNAPFTMQASASASYVTGSHALKFGFNNDFGTLTQEQYDNEYGLLYNFSGGIPDQYGRSTTPISLQQHALPFTQKTHLSADLGIYAQDKWTIQRATINAGIRFDYFKNDFPEQVLGPASFVPDRNVVVPATDYASLKDITPRVGVAYDLFGNGKTSLRSAWGKYMIGLSPLTGNPISLLAYTANRSWTDANGNYNPDCDLLNTSAQDLRGSGGDFCGALDNALFGQLRPSAAIDPETITGWGHRLWNQEFSVSVQQELAPRISADVGYFRRWYGNLTVVDNRAVGPSDFTRYSITAPVDPRQELSGQTISGLYDQTGNIGRVDNYTTFADNYGKQIEHWNGVDVTINTRPRDGVVLQGGFNVGRTTVDNCDLRASLPEITILAANVAPRQGAPAATLPTAVPDSQCHVDTAFLTQYKFFGTYLVPKIDVQFGVTYQATPGPEIVANYVLTPAQTTPQVPLNGGRVTNLVPPGQEFVKHIQQLDLRLSKILKMGRTRAVLSLDLANLLNANYTQLITTAYGSSWLAPTNIMDARLVKLAAQFDF
jgi:Carboxypeptidase regulatory-like domain